MQPFADWIQDPNKGFWVKKTWSDEEQRFLPQPGKIRLFHLEPVLRYALTPNEHGELPYETFVLSMPKKSGKTSWAAAIGAWAADQWPDGSELYFLANAKEQAEARSFKMLKFHAARTQAYVMSYRVEYPSGTFAQVLSTKAGSVAGGQQALTVFDELWAYDSESTRQLWEEMTPIPTETTQLRLIVTYAGYEADQGPLWDLYRMAVLDGTRVEDPKLGDLPCYVSKEGSVFAYWDHRPRMPWQTPEYYEKQAAVLRPGKFLQLHRNEWVSAEDAFIEVDLWDKAVENGKEAGLTEPLLYRPDSDYRQFPVSLAVDIGVKRDTSAVTGVYYDFSRGRIGLACHQIWTPTAGNELNIEHTIEDYVRQVYKELNVVSIVGDPTQFKRSMQTFEAEGMPVEEFPQSLTRMQGATQALYSALKAGIVEAYPSPDLRDHLRFAKVKIQNGKARIVKDSESERPVDGAVALAMAVADAIDKKGIDVSDEIKISSPFADQTGFKRNDSPDENIADMFETTSKGWRVPFDPFKSKS